MDVVHKFSVSQRIMKVTFQRNQWFNTEGISKGTSREKGYMQKNDNEYRREIQEH